MSKLTAGFRERCEAISTDWRARLGLRSFDPLPATKLALKMDVRLWEPKDVLSIDPTVATKLVKATDWFGVILFFDPATIVYHPSQSPARYESTIMHELAHFLLRHPPGSLYLAPDGNFKRDFKSQIETEAAYLGSSLQIPRRGVLWAKQKGLDESKMVSHFGASIEMVRWRCNIISF